MNRLPMHEALKSLAWLEGTWRTDGQGRGKFPTIKPFCYCEEIKFTSIGQPMFNYVAQSWHPEAKRPMHREVGFLRVIPNTNKVFLVLSHNIGVTSIEEGVLEDNTVRLASTGLLRQPEGMKPPAVTKLQRQFRLVGDCLEHVLCMATTTTTEITEHLRATYIKQSEESS